MRKFISLFIVLSSTAIVSFAATIIVVSSINDSGSNIHVTEDFLAKVSNPPNVDAKNDTSLPLVVETSPVKMKPSLNECMLAAQPISPIGKYLKAKGLPTTYEYRATQAEQLNIASYSGTVIQNTQLLKLMVQRDLETLGCPERTQE